MGTEWFKNMFLFPVMPSSDEDLKSIPYPFAELTVHITAKTVQLGSCLGALGAGVYRFAKSNRSIGLSRGLWAGGVIVGFAAGPALTYLVVDKKKIEEDGLYDRCYRLRHNQGQLRTDRVTALTSLAGLAANGLPGVAQGTVLGLAGLGAYNGYLMVEKRQAAAASNKEGAADQLVPIGGTATTQKKAGGKKVEDDLSWLEDKSKPAAAKPEPEEDTAVKHSPWLFNKDNWVSKPNTDQNNNKIDAAPKTAAKGCSICAQPPPRKQNEACKCKCHA